jgi:hypothetical protein
MSCSRKRKKPASRSGEFAGFTSAPTGTDVSNLFFSAGAVRSKCEVQCEVVMVR